MRVEPDDLSLALHLTLILRKRPRFREVFAGFEPERVAAFAAPEVERLLGDAGIIRLPLFVVQEHVAAGHLLPVLDHLRHKDYGIYVVHSANRRLNKRMRMLMEALEQACQLPD